MLIATYNVNGVNGCLLVLLRWLKEAKPDIVCLQELKAPEDKFPRDAIAKAGYSAIWQAKRAGTALQFCLVSEPSSKRVVACPAIPTIFTAAISRLKSMD